MMSGKKSMEKIMISCVMSHYELVTTPRETLKMQWREIATLPKAIPTVDGSTEKKSILILV